MTDFSFIMIRDGRTFIPVRAIPGAAKTEMVGIHAKAIKVRVAAAPERGKANAELESFFSELAEIPKNAVKVVRGLSSRDKLLELDISDPTRFLFRLEKYFILS